MMKRLLGIALAVSLGACGGSGSTSSTTQTVGSSGGAVTVTDGSNVAVPAGALTAPTVISISPVDNPTAPAGTTVVGPAYLFGPEGATFSTPVVISLAVVTSKLPTGKTINDVVIYTAPSGSTSYTALTTTVVDATHVSATTTHFSTFVPAAAGGSSSGCTVTCAPGSQGTCDCTTTCNDHVYTLTCFDLEGCFCKTDGTQTKSLPGSLRCTDTAGRQTAYGSCDYPGSFGAP